MILPPQNLHYNYIFFGNSHGTVCHWNSSRLTFEPIFFFFFCIFEFFHFLIHWGPGYQKLMGFKFSRRHQIFLFRFYISHFGAQYGPPLKWRRGLKIWTPLFWGNWDPFETETARKKKKKKKKKVNFGKKILRDYIPQTTSTAFAVDSPISSEIKNFLL